MKQQGFTLIELIIVIVILGILAVTAAPRFIDVQDDAQKAVAKQVAAALSSGFRTAHYYWQIKGKGQAVANLPGLYEDDVNFNEFGFPVDSGDKRLPGGNNELDLNYNRCGRIWNRFLDHSPGLHNSGAGNKADGETSTYYSDSSGAFKVKDATATSCEWDVVTNRTIVISYDAQTGFVRYSD